MMKQFRKDTFSIIVTNAITLLCGIIVSISIARLLGPALKGEYTVSLSFARLLMFMGNFGLGEASCYFAAKSKFNRGKIVNNTISLGILSSVIVLVVALLVMLFFRSAFFNQIPAYIILLAVTAAPINIINNYLRSLLLGEGKVKLLNILSLTRQVSELFFVVTLLFLFRAGVVGAILTYVLSTLLSLVLVLYYGLKKTKFSFGFDKNYVLGAVKYGYKSYAVNILSYINILADIFLVNYFLGPVSTGIYSIASSAAQLINFIPSSINPFLAARMASIKNKKTDYNFVLISFSILFVFYLIIIPLLFQYGGALIVLLFGGRFSGAIFPLKILLIGTIPLGIWTILSGHFLGLGQPNKNVFSAFIAAFLNIIFNIYLIPRIGIAGAAYASLISYTFLLLVMSLQILWRRYNWWRRNVKAKSIECTESKKKKILFIANILTHHQTFNSQLIYKMADRGWEVGVVAYKDTNLTIKENSSLKFINWQVDRTSTNFIGEFKSFVSLCRIIQKEKPDIIHNFTIKANIYGAFAGKIFSRAKIISTITGLGYTFIETSLQSWVKRTIIKLIWLSALNLSNIVIFQNRDDMNIFKKFLFNTKRDFVPGHGVDFSLFDREMLNTKQIKKIVKETGLRKNQLVITTVGRVIKQKGIVEFWQAAQRIISEFENTIFVVVGMTDNFNPSKIGRSEISKMKSDRFIFLNNRKDVKEILSLSDIFVLASYREGVAQAIVEAMAMGLPIITTNVPGCRERVTLNKNGLLVSVKNSDELYLAIKKLILDKELRIKMGKESYNIALKKYDSDFLTGKVSRYYFLK